MSLPALLNVGTQSQSSTGALSQRRPNIDDAISELAGPIFRIFLLGLFLLFGFAFIDTFAAESQLERSHAGVGQTRCLSCAVRLG